MSKNENLVTRTPKFKQLMRECDDQAASYWKQATSDREKGYDLWLKEVKKVSHFIDVFKKKDRDVDL